MLGYSNFYTCRSEGVAIAAIGRRLEHVRGGQQKILMPMFAACAPAGRPTLPERWCAVGRMIPFVRQQRYSLQQARACANCSRSKNFGALETAR
jgi:hypothetical protein